MNLLSSKHFRYSLVPPVLFLIILWLVALLQWGFDAEWADLGILPRTAEGLKGIVLSAFIHKNFSHLLANTPAIFILSWFVYYFYKEIANKVMFFIWGGSGVLTWIIGRPAYHVGASGMIYGLAFFLFFSGIFRRNQRLSAIALITVFVYGSLFWNMFPVAELVDPSVSWEGHLSGALVGLFTAVALRKEGPQPDPLPNEEDEDEDPDNNEVSDSDITLQSTIHEEKKAEKPDSK